MSYVVWQNGRASPLTLIVFDEGHPKFVLFAADFTVGNPLPTPTRQRQILQKRDRKVFFVVNEMQIPSVPWSERYILFGYIGGTRARHRSLPAARRCPTLAVFVTVFADGRTHVSKERCLRSSETSPHCILHVITFKRNACHKEALFKSLITTHYQRTLSAKRQNLFQHVTRNHFSKEIFVPKKHTLKRNISSK